MGLFDFVSDIGKKVFSKEEEASKAVTQHIAEDNPGVENLSVTVENGVANIQGVASTAAALEKAVLMAGNIQGIHSVTSDASINNGETLGSDETFYVIQKLAGYLTASNGHRLCFSIIVNGGMRQGPMRNLQNKICVVLSQ